jgi:hypothetical protein
MNTKTAKHEFGGYEDIQIFGCKYEFKGKWGEEVEIGTLRQARERLILSEFLELGKLHWLRQRGRRYVELGFNAIPHRFRENYLFIPHLKIPSTPNSRIETVVQLPKLAIN